MKNKYFYPIYKLKIKSWIKYWLIKQTEFKGVLSDILEGISFYLTDSLNMKFKMFDVIGRTTQESDPTPENPVPIKNTGDSGSINEKVQNKNLFDKSKATSGRYVKNTDGTLGYSDTLSASDFIKVRANVTYYQSNVNNYYSCLYDEDKNFIKQINSNAFTPTKNGYMRTSFLATNIDIVQVEQGSTETDYVSHSEQNISFPLAQGQKLMQGDYLADDGIHHKMGEKTLDGTEDWQYVNGQFVIYGTNYLKYSDGGKCYSSHFIGSAIDNLINVNLHMWIGNNTFILCQYDDITSLEDWKTFLAEQYANGTPVTVVYKKAEPTITPYTEGQQQYYDEHIKPLRTYKNITHISSEDETPALLKIQYWKEV